jgi:hypothetical protein
MGRLLYGKKEKRRGGGLSKNRRMGNMVMQKVKKNKVDNYNQNLNQKKKKNIVIKSIRRLLC